VSNFSLPCGMLQGCSFELHLSRRVTPWLQIWSSSPEPARLNLGPCLFPHVLSPPHTPTPYLSTPFFLLLSWFFWRLQGQAPEFLSLIIPQWPWPLHMHWPKRELYWGEEH
jgi:hypothetical protein